MRCDRSPPGVISRDVGFGLGAVIRRVSHERQLWVALAGPANAATAKNSAPHVISVGSYWPPDPTILRPKKIRNKMVIRERRGAWIYIRTPRFWGPGSVSLRDEGGGAGSIAYTLTPRQALAGMPTGGRIGGMN